MLLPFYVKSAELLHYPHPTGEVTKWLHPECAKPANVAKLKGFDELAPADQERLRSLAQDESPSLGSEPHRKRIRTASKRQRRRRKR